MNRTDLAVAACAGCFFLAPAGAAIIHPAATDTLSTHDVLATTMQTTASSRAAYLEFRGEYDLDNGARLSFFRSGRQYFVEVSGQPKIEVRATSPRTFAAVDGSAELTFAQHANGVLSHLSLKRAARN